MLQNMMIGNKDKFAFEIGENRSGDLHQVDIWVADVKLTFFDTMAYVPQFIHSVEKEAQDIEDGKINDEYILLNWGPTTDDVIARGRIKDDFILINCDLADGRVATIIIETKQLLSLYRNVVSELKKRSV